MGPHQKLCLPLSHPRLPVPLPKGWVGDAGLAGAAAGLVARAAAPEGLGSRQPRVTQPQQCPHRWG